MLYNNPKFKGSGHTIYISLKPPEEIIHSIENINWKINGT
jgi:hypothetical protein